MKTMRTTIHGHAKGVQLCSAVESSPDGPPNLGLAKSITIAGQTFVPDAATAYVEFEFSHAFPVYLDVPEPGQKPARTTIHPQTLANSYRSLLGKVLNLAHIMRSYNPQQHVRDRILGTVMAVELSVPDGPLTTPEGGWKVQGDAAQAPGIRAVAALHKNAEGVMVVLDTWERGKTPFSETKWTVSMENEAYLDEGGFLIRGQRSEIRGLPEGQDATPADFRALGWTYVPWAVAPAEMRDLLQVGSEVGLAGDYQGRETLFLNGGLNGRMFYYGVALTPLGKESRAQVLRMEASATAKASNLDLATVAGAAELCDALAELAGKVLG